MMPLQNLSLFLECLLHHCCKLRSYDLSKLAGQLGIFHLGNGLSHNSSLLLEFIDISVMANFYDLLNF